MLLRAGREGGVEIPSRNVDPEASLAFSETFVPCTKVTDEVS